MLEATGTDTRAKRPGQGLYFRVGWGRLAAQRALPGQAARLASSGLHLGVVPEPALPPGWVELKPKMAGICGSDMALMKGQSSPFMRPLTSFPAVLGHEIVAVTQEGQRVAVEPTLSCAARGLPPCQMCALGQSDDCLRRGDPGMGAGLMLGYHARVPGGWSQRMWAPQSQLVPVPEGMPDERAVLTEPAAIVLTGLKQVEWSQAAEVLIIGAGALGLLSTALIAELYPAAKITAVARYPRQRDLVQQMGAQRVAGGTRRDPAIKAVTGEPVPTLPGFPPYYPRGFDVVVVAAGSESALAEASRLVKAGGQVLLLGGVAQAAIDWTPIWSRHVRIIGSYGYGESGVDTFRAVLSLFSVMSQPLESLVTHQFPLEDYRGAVRAALGHTGAIKTVFVPN